MAGIITPGTVGRLFAETFRDALAGRVKLDSKPKSPDPRDDGQFWCEALGRIVRPEDERWGW